MWVDSHGRVSSGDCGECREGRPVPGEKKPLRHPRACAPRALPSQLGGGAGMSLMDARQPRGGAGAGRGVRGQ